MKVILLVGLPGSGKSTWLNERGIVAISTDHIRELLTGNASDQSANSRVFALAHSLLRQRLEFGVAETYIDATNLTRKERQEYIKIAAPFNAAVEALYFDVPLEVCRANNASRSRVVPDDAMERLAGKLQPPAIEEGLTRITVVSSQMPARASEAAARQAP